MVMRGPAVPEPAALGWLLRCGTWSCDLLSHQREWCLAVQEPCYPWVCMSLKHKVTVVGTSCLSPHFDEKNSEARKLLAAVLQRKYTSVSALQQRLKCEQLLSLVLFYLVVFLHKPRLSISIFFFPSVIDSTHFARCLQEPFLFPR